MTEALAASGTIPPRSNHIPANTPTVSLGLWRRHFYQRNPESKIDTRKTAFRRNRQALQDGLVGVWGPENGKEEGSSQCWRIRQPGHL